MRTFMYSWIGICVVLYIWTALQYLPESFWANLLR
jgi:hypothetical protein